MRYFMRLSYLGAGFAGWQIQPDAVTVQGVIEQAMQRLLGVYTPLTGAGRTDAGVNARMMVAHFDAAETLPHDFVYRLGAMVGRDITIDSVWPVADDAHARFDATERVYRYYVATRKSPFLYPLCWRAIHAPDFEAMNSACRYLIGKQDFTSFSKLHTQVKTNICDIRLARWVRVASDDAQDIASDAGLWYFEIAADRFLRNMVRAIVGTLIDVGHGKYPPEHVREVIEQRNRCAAGSSMPGHGLYLWEVKYSSFARET